jgi:cell wall-associated NlpC family hydrolase
MRVSLDPRVTLVRDGIADARLEGIVKARCFKPARASQAIVSTAALRAAPDPGAEQLDQLLFGEGFDVFEVNGQFVFGQAWRDGYVGWVQAVDLGEQEASPTHWVSALRTFPFAEPSIKAPARGPLSLNALVRVIEESETLVRADRIGWIARAHLSPIGIVFADPAKVALAHLGAPYLWGGRDSAGLDCSGLIQQALLACGVACPRDSDQQQALGAAASPAALERSDLVFWKGHVGMMLDARRLIHANAHHMAVTVEPLARTQARILAKGGGAPIAYRRLSLQTPGRRRRKP